MKITSQTLQGLLKNKHAKDVYVDECKDGPTQGVGVRHLRLDAWAMARSWANPTTWGYEIKVSRSDFLGDDKWQSYLKYCSDFYFVCPSGLIQPNELPGEVGLLWASKTGTRLYSKKKAVRRDVEIPESLYRYVLMCRSKISRGTEFGIVTSGREFWEEWLKSKKSDLDFGHRVSQSIRSLVAEKITKVECENLLLRKQNESLEDIRCFLKEIGVDPDRHYLSRLNVEAAIARLNDLIPSDLRASLRMLESSLRRTNIEIEKASKVKS